MVIKNNINLKNLYKIKMIAKSKKNNHKQLLVIYTQVKPKTKFVLGLFFIILTFSLDLILFVYYHLLNDYIILEHFYFLCCNVLPYRKNLEV